MVGSGDGGRVMAEASTARTITITDDEAELIDRFVAEGRIESAADIVNAGIVAVATQDDLPGDPEFERWLQEVVVPRLDRRRTRPEPDLTPEQVEAHLEERRAERGTSPRFGAAP